MITHAFFDFFGTLVEYDQRLVPVSRLPTWSLHSNATVSEVCADLAWRRAWERLESEAVRTRREYAMTDVVDQFFQLVGLVPGSNHYRNQLITDYLHIWSQGVAPAPGLIESLDKLSGDFILAVVSNTHACELVPTLLTRFGIDHYFTSVTTSVEVGWRKPDLQIFSAAMRSVQLTDPARGIFAGDSWSADVLGARAAGMTPAWVTHHGPSRYRGDLQSTTLPALAETLLIQLR